MQKSKISWNADGAIPSRVVHELILLGNRLIRFVLSVM